MTTIESIQMNIHHYKMELIAAKKVICKDEIDKIQNQAWQENSLKELEGLDLCLKIAIKQTN